MKTCSKCRVPKDRSEFPGNRTKKDGLSYYCRDCQSGYTKRHYAENKDYYLNKANVTRDSVKEMIRIAKTRPCLDCEILYPHYVMEFDHVRGIKKFNLGFPSHGRFKAQAEMKKCEVVCSNCHRERTHQRRQAKKLLAI